MTQVVLLAAGRGSRLGALTERRSKAMMPVLGMPMIGWALNMFFEAGVQSFVVVIRPGDRELREYLKNDIQGQIEIKLAEQPKPLGMGHALSCAAPLLYQRFLLSACDSVFSQSSIQDFVSQWQRRKDLGVLLSLERAVSQDLSQRSVVMMEDRRVVQIIEKPAPWDRKTDVTSLPLYGLNQNVLDEITQLKPSSRGEIELQPAIQGLIDQGVGVEGVFVERRWNLTTTKDLLGMNLQALQEIEPTDQKTLEKQWRARIHPPVIIEPGVVLGPNSELGPEVYLEGGCEIGAEVRLFKAVVLRRARIPAGSRIARQVIG